MRIAETLTIMAADPQAKPKAGFPLNKQEEEKKQEVHFKIRHYIHKNDKQGHLLPQQHKSKLIAITKARKYNNHPRTDKKAGERYVAEQHAGPVKEVRGKKVYFKDEKQ